MSMMSAGFRPATTTQLQDLQQYNQGPSFQLLVGRYPGIKAIHDECNRIYPDQLNPLQIQSIVKSWRGGPDPLDCISMLENKGDSWNNVPSHWHYVSYGLSDLHCDGRVFTHPVVAPDKSGFGFELTFRLKKTPGEISPPLWPAKLMQNLARYVYNSGQPFLPGDHISWHQSVNLDDPNSNKVLCQILLAPDPQLEEVLAPSGTCEFIQIIPVTTEELLSAQKWNVLAFLDRMKDMPQCGGKFLVTDMSRVESIFELKPDFGQELVQCIARDGSDLSGVNAVGCYWSSEGWRFFDNTNYSNLSESYQHANRRESENRLSHPEGIPGKGQIVSDDHGCPRTEDINHLVNCFHTKCNVGPTLPECQSPSPADENENDSDGDNPSSLRRTQDMNDVTEGTNSRSTIMDTCVTYFDCMHVILNSEAAFYLPLALTGRLRHGRHFTFQDTTSGTAITFTAPTVKGAFVSLDEPFGAAGPWLQILLTDEFVDVMLLDLEQFFAREHATYPKTFVWPKWKFGLTLVLSM